VSFSFKIANKNTLGYDMGQVDDFISRARAQFAEPNSSVVAADAVRSVEFDLVKGGYLIEPVDAAIERLEETFAAREIQRQKSEKGAYALDDRLARVTEIVRGRLQRPRGKKFSSTGWLLRGYSRKQVDALCDRISRHLESGLELSPAEVRRSIFQAKRGGYAESQVDAFIDRVIEVLQIEAAR
jgi:DivIVA domain-containing protein